MGPSNVHPQQRHAPKPMVGKAGSYLGTQDATVSACWSHGCLSPNLGLGSPQACSLLCLVPPWCTQPRGQAALNSDDLLLPPSSAPIQCHAYSTHK
jgi:hypothetical protein